MSLKLTFLGGAGTVTGSKYLLEQRRTAASWSIAACSRASRRCACATGRRLPVAPGSIAAVVLTHAHLDHSGYLPLLVKNGFRGPIFCTEATADLCGILLPDSGHLQEQDADFANRHRFSKHNPALPLYTEDDAQRRWISCGRCLSARRLLCRAAHARISCAPAIFWARPRS